MDFQKRVTDWMSVCFSPDITLDVNERMYRFLEEALELAQASGCSPEDARELVEYVFRRPIGEAKLEAGGALVTLAGLCAASGIDMLAAGEEELARNWERLEIIRAKRAQRRSHSPLPL